MNQNQQAVNEEQALEALNAFLTAQLEGRLFQQDKATRPLAPNPAAKDLGGKLPAYGSRLSLSAVAVVPNQNGFDELDEQLKQLAAKAQQHPLLSQGRQLALTKLVNAIVQSGRLCRPYHGLFSLCYDEIYQEALHLLLLYICQNIDNYDPECTSVMAWANVLLKRRFFKEAMPKILDKQGVQRMTLADLDNVTPT